jgi:hypothetical protein
MTVQSSAWQERQRRRWLRPNAHLYWRPDAARFLPAHLHDLLPPELRPSAHDGYDRSRPNVAQWTGRRGRWTPAYDAALQAEQRREAAAKLRALLDLKFALTGLRRDLARERFKRAFLRWTEAVLRDRKAGFRPDQPRWPAGSGRISGRWSGGAGTGGPVDDPKPTRASPTLTDETPQNDAKPGARYAASKRPQLPSRSRMPGAGAGRALTRVERLRLYADFVERIRQIDPDWKPQAPDSGLFDSAEEVARRDAAQMDEAVARLAELAQRSPEELIAAYRANADRYWLFGARPLDKNDAVSMAVFNGQPEFGVNSTSRAYRFSDLIEASRTVRELVARYPEIMKTENIGQKPNDALYHAEATLLLRLANKNGGMLAGHEIEIYVDKEVCPESCRPVLPYLGLKLGNPRVTFVETTSGFRVTMQDGKWE